MSHMQNAMLTLIRRLSYRLGRVPTDDEVHDFIFGDEAARSAVWGQTNSDDDTYIPPEDELNERLSVLLTHINNGDSHDDTGRDSGHEGSPEPSPV